MIKRVLPGGPLIGHVMMKHRQGGRLHVASAVFDRSRDRGRALIVGLEGEETADFEVGVHPFLERGGRS